MKVAAISTLFESIQRQPALAAILLAGFCFRIINIDWGIPYFDEFVGRYHPDEWKISLAAVQFPQYFWENTDFRYPTFFHLVNAVLFQPFRLVLHYFFGTDARDLHDLATIFARCLSALAGTATIYFCYKLGKALSSHTAGLVAAALCCTSLYHVISSGYSTNDVMTSFFVALLMLQLIDICTNEPSRSRYVLTGITYGILIGTKYTGGAALILIAMAYVWMIKPIASVGDSGSGRRAALAITGNYLLMGAASAATFIATTPGLVVRFADFIASLNELRTVQELKAFRGTRLDAVAEVLLSYVSAYGAMITGVFLLSTIFLVLRARYRRWQDYFLLSVVLYALAYTLFIGRSMQSRYLIMIAPAIVLSIAASWDIVRNMRSKWTAALANVLIGLTLASSLVITVLGVYSRHGDTRTVAAHFIDERVIPGTSIGYSFKSEKYRDAHQWRYPVVDFDGAYVRTDMLDYPEVLIVSSYDTGSIKEGLSSPYLSDDLVWDSAGPINWYLSEPPGPRVFAFYKELLAGEGPYQLVAEFTQATWVPISFPAPTISIFRREDASPVVDQSLDISRPRRQ